MATRARNSSRVSGTGNPGGEDGADEFFALPGRELGELPGDRLGAAEL
ncbi:MAG: hypothetical protein ACRDP7_45330 [Trebonia sp.]